MTRSASTSSAAPSSTDTASPSRSSAPVGHARVGQRARSTRCRAAAWISSRRGSAATRSPSGSCSSRPSAWTATTSAPLRRASIAAHSSGDGRTGRPVHPDDDPLQLHRAILAPTRRGGQSDAGRRSGDVSARGVEPVCEPGGADVLPRRSDGSHHDRAADPERDPTDPTTRALDRAGAGAGRAADRALAGAEAASDPGVGPAGPVEVRGAAGPDRGAGSSRSPHRPRRRRHASTHCSTRRPSAPSTTGGSMPGPGSRTGGWAARPRRPGTSCTSPSG